MSFLKFPPSFSIENILLNQRSLYSPFQDQPSPYLWLDSCKNTQDQMWSILDQDLKIRGYATGEQIEGRGRQGKVWLTPPQHALALSWRPALFKTSSLNIEMLTLFPFLGAIAVVYTLVDWGIPKDLLYIKWPNDVVILIAQEERDSPSLSCDQAHFPFLKLAGVLCEGRQIHNHLHVVVGCGINLLPHPSLPEYATTLSQWSLWFMQNETSTPRSDSLPHLITHLATTLFKHLDQEWKDIQSRIQGRGKSILFQKWREYELPHGTSLYTPTHTGTYQGIDEEGGLLLQTPSGLHTITTGEVSLVDIRSVLI